MRIALYSNSPNAPTGYGTQTRMLVEHLAADGHDVAVLSNWGHSVGVLPFETPSGPVPIFPTGRTYSLDVAAHQATLWFKDEPGWVISLYDAWVFPEDYWGDQRLISWTPIDHDPLPILVHRFCSKYPTIAMSRFGQDKLAQAGIKASYIPHGIGAQWTPRESDVRRQLNVPDDAFLVMMNAANIPPDHLDRKAWDPNLRAFAAFARAHDDVYIYIHTDPTRGGGFPIPAFLKFAQLPEERTRITDLVAYRMGLIKSDTIAELYSAADVLLSCSMGEGFGLPVAEAMACGTPAIVSDFSAQPEIVGDTGWTVPVLPYWDKMQHTDLAWPDCYAIFAALEEAYEERNTAKAAERSQAAIAHIRAEYDADTVYAEKWRPLLAELDAELHPNPVAMRRGGSKASRKRMRKAA